MARNPELDYEYRESKPKEKPIQIVYRDHDSMPADPIEMRTITQLGGLPVKGWKQTLIAALAVVAALAVGSWLLFSVFPSLGQFLNPGAPPPIT